MKIDGDPLHTGLLEAADHPVDQRFAAHRERRFRNMPGERHETAADAGGQDNGVDFHNFDRNDSGLKVSYGGAPGDQTWDLTIRSRTFGGSG